MNTRISFFRAVMAGDAAQVSAMLEREPQLARERSPAGATALHLAAHYGHRDVAAALIVCGADVNARTLAHPIRTPLLVAVLMQQVELADLLLDHGADPELPDGIGWRPLHIAALQGYADIVRVLLAHGADVNTVDGAMSTPLVLAERRRHAEVVELLSEASLSKREHRQVGRGLGEPAALPTGDAPGRASKATHS